MISVLLVDPDVTAAAAVAKALALTLDLDVRLDFPAARARLDAQPPQLLVTALRLREYNGLHLVHLAARAGTLTRSVVFTDVPDPVASRETRAAGAFYEIRTLLPMTVPAYASATLPPSDRRESLRSDRRRLARGGRRAADHRLPPRARPEDKLRN